MRRWIIISSRSIRKNLGTWICISNESGLRVGIRNKIFKFKQFHLMAFSWACGVCVDGAAAKMRNSNAHVCASNETGGSTIRNEIFFAVAVEAVKWIRYGRKSHDRNVFVGCDTPYAAAQRIMVFRGKIEIHHRTGWRAFVHVKGQTNGQSHESCAWARHLLLALSTGDWTAEGFNETKWFRKCGDVVHSKSTRIEIIDFLHRQRAPGEEWWVMMALNIVKAVAFLCGMKWLCFAVSVDNAPYSNKMRLPTSNNSQI